MSKLKPCPFCGSAPIFPVSADCIGTCYDAGCEECGVASISIQIIDCFGYEESPNRTDARNSWSDRELKYGNEFINVARNVAINLWNTRTGELVWDELPEVKK